MARKCPKMVMIIVRIMSYVIHHLKTFIKVNPLHFKPSWTQTEAWPSQKPTQPIAAVVNGTINEARKLNLPGIRPRKMSSVGPWQNWSPTKNGRRKDGNSSFVNYQLQKKTLTGSRVTELMNYVNNILLPLESSMWKLWDYVNLMNKTAAF